ncbi:MAG: TIGR00730 family Rossman fold protein [Campylobacterales bacterium]|nr:TIGR00730 family Rossman fold protein [Campylobacterales bacterium]
MNIAVFCGSSGGKNPLYAKETAVFGEILAKEGHALVYGGGKVGLMGTVADAVLGQGGHVMGVIPQSLEQKELAHTGVSELHIVNNMHERKAMMAARGDAFVALPGGVGTLEEIFEAWTWAQLGYHKKPIAFLDIGGFYTHLFAFLAHVKEEGFMYDIHHEMLIIEADPHVLLEKIKAYLPPRNKWE